MNAMLDSGARKSYIGNGYNKLFINKSNAMQSEVLVANGQALTVEGKIKVTFKIDGVSKRLDLFLVDGLQYECILGIDFKRLFNFNVDYGNDTWSVVKGIKHKFYPYGHDPTCFPALAPLGGLASATENDRKAVQALLDELVPPTPEVLGVTKLVEHKIDVQGHAPIKQRIRRTSPRMLRAAQEEVDRMLQQGIIEPSSSPWSSCPVIVPKADGKCRFCIDYRPVNGVTKKDAYCLRHMDDILDRLRPARFISKIDLSQAYHQIPLDKASREITAFAVPGRGLFQFTRMPYGLSNAPASFQRIIDQLMRPEWEPFVYAYLDDIVIVTATIEEHLYWLRVVLEALRDANLQINREKSEFLCSEVRYLGYVLNEQGLQTSPEKILPIMEYPAPQNLRQLRRFLGMMGWYARFIPDLAKWRVPLNKLTGKDVRWKWGQEQQEAFEKMKKALTEAPVLARPDLSQPFSLQTDASDYAIAGVLTQEVEGEEHPIYYVSRSLGKAERNYTTTEKECLAVLWSVERLRGYLQGESFKVITDHHSLLWLQNLKDPAGRLARWHTQLNMYDIEFVHRKGSLHKVPDALSRALESHLDIAALTPADVTDPWYARRLTALSKSPRKFPEWRIENGLLYSNRPNQLLDPLLPDLDSWKLVLPKADRERALFEAHNDPQAGHLGVEKTYARLAIYYYWPGFFYDTTCYVRACQECQAHKSSQFAPAGLMGERNIEGPWSVVSADIIGPKPPSKGGFKYIVVFEDLFTKYVELKALKRADGKNILKAFDELIVNRWGCPKYLLTDNGTEFANKLVTENLKEYGIVQSTIPPYHAQANPVERVNRTLKSMINSFVSEDHRDWDLHLREFAFALNSVEHSSTKVSPAFLNFGRNPRPAHVLRKHLENPVPLDPPDPEIWLSRVKRLPALHDLVKRHLDQATARHAKYYNKGRRDIQFNLDDRVMKRNHVLSSAAQNFAAKLAPKFVGPCKIVRVYSPLVYDVEDESTKKVVKVHISDLKRYTPPRNPCLKYPIISSYVSEVRGPATRRVGQIQTGSHSKEVGNDTTRRPRGRPKNKPVETNITDSETDEVVFTGMRLRNRPRRSNDQPVLVNEPPAPPKRRGRPRKIQAT